ncbi:MAG TPA: glycosyltransferase family 2 protein [Gammaproteobacteria bacterium]|nr:glycosyltransferase family 2 protein [Gammaproteobacteria bacterium]
MISIVVPAYNEERNLDVLYARLREQLESLRMHWELVIVDDGSADATWNAITRLSERDPRVRGLRLSRNFGHQSALLAGLAAARGKAVVTMDADLQHPPEIVPELVRRWQDGYQIVHGLRRDPPSVPYFKRLTSKLYYRLFSYLSGVEIQPGAADFRLIDRQVLDEILKFKEEGMFLRGIVHWVGYATTSVTFDCSPRHAGTSAYSLRKMLGLAWHGVSSFSLVPLRVAMGIGLLSSIVAFVGVCYAILGKWLDKEAIPGWASTVAIVSFLFGALFVFLAVLAEYVGRIVVEVRGRPRFLVRETTRAVRAAAEPRRASSDSVDG